MNVLSRKIDAKETSLFVTVCCFSGFWKNTINPSPLMIAKTTVIVGKSKTCSANMLARSGTLMFEINSVMPPTCPLFSITVASVKYAKHDGTPKPNETPRKRETVHTWEKSPVTISAGSNDVIIPKIVHV